MKYISTVLVLSSIAATLVDVRVAIFIALLSIWALIADEKVN